MSSNLPGNDIRWVKYPVLDDGFVCLVDWMGDDRSVAQAARVSYGSEAKTPADDVRLIRYLMKHHHLSPFEMAELKFLVRVPMDTWRQWVRHRTASVNERSTRYSVVDDAFAKTSPDAWRRQSDTNRQGSGSPIPVSAGEKLSQFEKELHDNIYTVYQNRIDMGVAREQARKDLPLSTYTEAYWKIDLRNLLHFLELRLAPDAQYEIRQYANAISGIVQTLFPGVWDAFVVFCLERVDFDGMERRVLRQLLRNIGRADIESAIKQADLTYWFSEGSRSRSEIEQKINGILEE